MNHKCKALKLLLMEGNQPTPSAQEVAYVQELDGEVMSSMISIVTFEAILQLPHLVN